MAHQCWPMISDYSRLPGTGTAPRKPPCYLLPATFAFYISPFTYRLLFSLTTALLLLFACYFSPVTDCLLLLSLLACYFSPATSRLLLLARFFSLAAYVTQLLACCFSPAASILFLESKNLEGRGIVAISTQEKRHAGGSGGGTAAMETAA